MSGEKIEPTKEWTQAAILYCIAKAGPGGLPEEEITKAINELSPEERFQVGVIEQKYIEVGEANDWASPLPQEAITEFYEFMFEVLDGNN